MRTIEEEKKSSQRNVFNFLVVYSVKHVETQLVKLLVLSLNARIWLILLQPAHQSSGTFKIHKHFYP